MKFKDLKTGMFIKTRNDDYGVVVNDKIIFKDGCYDKLSYWEETDLEGTYIKSVYPIIDKDGLINCFNTLHSGDAIPIWSYEPILTLVEKQYLKDVIRPFKDRVESISKIVCYADKCYIHIELDTDSISLPFFDIDDYYLGMEPDKEYSLEELRLNDE